MKKALSFITVLGMSTLLLAPSTTFADSFEGSAKVEFTGELPSEPVTTPKDDVFIGKGPATGNGELQRIDTKVTHRSGDVQTGVIQTSNVITTTLLAILAMFGAIIGMIINRNKRDA